MSQPTAEDPDPLLAFAIEPGAAVPVALPPQPASQPVAAPVDPPSPSPSSIPLDTLVTRIDRLERALEDSKAQVSSLRSEVATLVRAIGDIRKQPGRGNTAVPRTARAPRVMSAILGIVLGLGAGVFGWMYLTSGADTAIVASAPAPPPQVVPEPAPAAPIEPAAPVAAPPRTAPITARVAAQTSPAAPVRYVGTLTIDAEPDGDVFVDRESAGHTPLRLTNLRAGSHLIWVEREGYHRWTRVVQVTADGVTRLSAELEPIAAR